MQRFRLLQKFDFWAMLLCFVLIMPALSQAAVTPVTGTITTDFTFQEGETYSVTGPVTMTGATTFEGGTTIKFDSTGSLNVSDPSFKTTFSNQITFTSKDDDSIGEVVAGSTGSPSSYPNALILANGNVRFVQIRYADEGIVFAGNDTLTIRDSEFFAVGAPVNASSSAGPASVSLNNLLIANGTNGPVLADDGTNALTVTANNITMAHLTGDGFSTTTTAAGSSLSVTDSLFVDVQGASVFAGTPPSTENFNAFFQTPQNGTGANDVILNADPLLTDFFLDQASSVINAGSQSSTAAGMYHYNTNADGTIEGPTQVDIGYHASPSINQFSILALKSIWMKSGSMVSGDIAVNQATAGPFLDSNVALAVGHDMVLPAAINLRADSIKVKTGAVINGKVHHNQLENNGTINSVSITPLAFPVLDELPLFRTATLGTVSDINVVAGTTHVLAPGDYGVITVNDNATLQFTGGLYQIQKIDAKKTTSLLFDAASEVRIKENLVTKRFSTLGASAGVTLTAGDIRFYVEGNDVGSQLAIDFGHTHTVKGHFYAPNGTLSLKRQSTFSGIFLGKDVMIGHDSQVELDEGTGQPIVATPAITPNGGTFVETVTVNLSTITSGATIHYTTDGSTPTTASPVFSAPITLITNTATQTIKAIAVRSSFIDSSVASADFIVNDPNTAPVAAFTRSPTFGSVPLTVSFDASTSTDTENNIATYAWDFGDGNTGTGITTTHEYTTPGTFSVTLTVTDDPGLSDTTTEPVTVNNTAPFALFTSAPSSGNAPLTVTFDGSLSNDLENNIATYTWDFGDSTTETGITTTHIYPTVGTFTVSLTVTDAFGLTSQDTRDIIVTPNSSPNIAITSPSGGGLVIQNRPEIQLSYLDDTAVDTASLALLIDGSPLASTCTTTESSATCTPTEDLPEGNVVLSATISDTEGLSGTSVPISFIVDSVPVGVSIIAPFDRSITPDAQTVVTGTLGPTAVSVEVNGIPAAITGSDFSATVPLREGKNMLIATARNTNNKTGVSTVDVTRDIQKPIIRINSPRDGFPAVENSITLTGVVNDIVNGGVAATVTINGTPVPVVNGTFLADNLQLIPGPNIFEAVATDAAGNTGSHNITVNFQVPAGPKLVLSSGNGQQAQIGTPLVEPLTVQIVDSQGFPAAGRTVRFEVTRNNGTLSGSGVVLSNRIIAATTDGNGEARVNLTLGSTAGGGNNRVKATSTGVAGEIEFCATGLPNPPSQIINEMGDNQRGPVGEPLPIPLEALATDSGGNPAAGVDVTFNVTKGGGNFDGQGSTTVTTGTDGIARAVFTLGFDAGINNNVATATFPGLTNLAATFTASGLVTGDPADTTFSGVVLDSGQTPIPGATVTIEGTTVSGTTDANGQFLLTSVPVGAFVLKVDPADSPRPETFPPLEFEIVTISGVENTLGMPVILPQINTDMAKLVGGNEDVVLEMKGVPGATLTVLANSAIFPGGSTTGIASVSQVHMDQVPMPPPNGTLPPLAGTLQPLGAHYDPPIRVQYPNSNGLAPGSIIEMFQFHHDTSRFVPVGKATVTEDGRFLVTDPGFGLQTGGWHIGSESPPPPSCSPSCGQCNTPVVTNQQTCEFTCEPETGTSCNDGDQCTAEDTCQEGVCVGSEEDAEGASCDDGILCTGDDMCKEGECVGDPEAANGTVCDDEILCTANDVCTDGVCLGDAEAANGTVCDDEILCTANDVCTDGICVGDTEAANGITCDDLDQCTANDVCTDGACVGSTEDAEGASCDDGILCTGNDMCVGGNCEGDPVAANGITCDDEILCTGNDVCTDGVCMGNAEAANGITCDDDEVCTGNDVCTDGICVGDPTVQEGQTCDSDGEFCTSDTCQAGNCVASATPQEGKACDDGEFCTGNDVCTGGTCVGDPAVQQGKDCNPGQSCTGASKCVSGQCSSTDIQVNSIEGPDFVVVGETATFYAEGPQGQTFDSLEWQASNAHPVGLNKGPSAKFKFLKKGDAAVVQAMCKNVTQKEKGVLPEDACERVTIECPERDSQNRAVLNGQEKNGICYNRKDFAISPFKKTIYGAFKNENFEFGEFERCVKANQFCLKLKNPLWNYFLQINPNNADNFQIIHLLTFVKANQTLSPETCKEIAPDFEIKNEDHCFKNRLGQFDCYDTDAPVFDTYLDESLVEVHENKHRDDFYDLDLKHAVDLMTAILENRCTPDELEINGLIKEMDAFKKDLEKIVGNQFKTFSIPTIEKRAYAVENATAELWFNQVCPVIAP